MSETIETLPEIRAYVLWHCNYWDGPLSGVCLVEDRVCWFQTPADPLDDEREWFIYEMTDTEARAEMTQHLLFERYVGIHTCVHATLDGQRPIGSTHPQEQWAQFYDHATEYDYVTDKQPIGKLIR